MQIFVRMPTGETTPIEVNNSDTIWTVKYKIVDKGEFLPDPQQITWTLCTEMHTAGRRLKDGRTLSDYNIKEQSTLDLLLRPFGKHTPYADET